MSYDDIEIEDMEWKEELNAFTYMCPCGDLFQITKVVSTAPCFAGTCLAQPLVRARALNQLTVVQEELAAGEEIAHCPSCSLYITVIYDPVCAGELSFRCQIGGLCIRRAAVGG